MILALDVGNSNIFGGVIDGSRMLFQFRKSSKVGVTSDELGVFLRGVLGENSVSSADITHIAICSVVPDLFHTLNNTCLKYFKLDPFILKADVKTGLDIKYLNPRELGTDRIANAIAATHLFPGRNILIADFGTATTVCAVTKDKAYLGGMILPGIRISMQSLASETAKLPIIEIAPPGELLGKSTVENIQSGLYYGHLMTIREVCKSVKKDYFYNENMTVIGTGGFARLFERENFFDKIIPDLVLMGLSRAVELNAMQR